MKLKYLFSKIHLESVFLSELFIFFKTVQDSFNCWRFYGSNEF